ncbi:MAG: hypothetical protein ABIN36_18325 [Ferruginibacter sp.]
MVRNFFIKEFILAGIIFMGISCGEDKKNISSQNEVTNTTTIHGGQEESNVSNRAIIGSDTTLKDISVNEKYFIKKTKSVGLISRNLFDSLGLASIPFPSNLKNDLNLKIKIADTLIINEKTKMLIVSVESENEHWAWLLAYDSNNKVSKAEKLFYEDFVEYFSKTTTEVKYNKIFITTEMESEDGNSKTVRKFLFLNGEKLDKIK